jgi:hypothetical protein
MNSFYYYLIQCKCKWDKGIYHHFVMIRPYFVFLLIYLIVINRKFTINKKTTTT